MKKLAISASDALKRTVTLLEPGLVRIDQDISSKGLASGFDITGKYWMFGLVRVHEGSVAFTQGNAQVIPKSNVFGMFAPPYSVVEASLHNAVTRNIGFASKEALPSFMPKVPVLLSLDSAHTGPATLADIFRLVANCSERIEIGRAKHQSSVARRCKEILDRSYYEDMPLSGIAKKTKTSPSVLSQHFKRDFGLTPIKYRQWLRVIDGMMQLLEGKAIINVAQEVGYSDLGRFYKQFQQITSGTPGKYALSKNKKTPRLQVRDHATT